MEMTKFRKPIAIAAVCFLAGFSFARNASEILGTETYSKVKETGKIETVTYVKDAVKFGYMPDSELSFRLKNAWTGKNQPVKIVEDLYLINKKDFAQADSITIENLSRISRSISSMKGMKYFSSRKKWEVLYKDCSRIDGKNSKVRVADDNSGKADGTVLYCFLDDNSLGKTNYEVSYFQTEKELVGCFKNTSPIWVGPVKAVEEENLCICFQFIDCGDELLVYLATEANFPSVAMLEKKLNESLASRLDAVFRWFTSQF